MTHPNADIEARLDRIIGLLEALLTRPPLDLGQGIYQGPTMLFGYVSGSGEKPSEYQRQAAMSLLSGRNHGLPTPTLAFDVAREILHEFDRHRGGS